MVNGINCLYDPVNFFDPDGFSRLKQALQSSKVRAGLSMGASFLADHAAQNMEPGKIRAIANGTAGLLANISAAEWGFASAMSIAMGVSATIAVSPFAGIGMGVLLAGASVYEIYKAINYYDAAIKDWNYIPPCP